MAGTLMASTAVPEGLNSISVVPDALSLNGAWNASPALFANVLSQNTITRSPGASVISGNVNWRVALACWAMT